MPPFSFFLSYSGTGHRLRPEAVISPLDISDGGNGLPCLRVKSPLLSLSPPSAHLGHIDVIILVGVSISSTSGPLWVWLDGTAACAATLDTSNGPSNLFFLIGTMCFCRKKGNSLFQYPSPPAATSSSEFLTWLFCSSPQGKVCELLFSHLEQFFFAVFCRIL